MSLSLPAAGAETDKATARAHFEAATRLYDIKEFAKAVEEYKAAYLAKPDPAFLFNIGQCYRKLGKNAEALEFYREYLKKASVDDPSRPNVEARVREMESGEISEAERSAKSPEREPEAAGTYFGRRDVEPAQVYREAAPLPASSQASPLAPTSSGPVPTPDGSSAVDAQRLDLTTTNAADQASTQNRFYRTWWFWTGVGAVAVAATVVAIVASSGGSHANSAGTALGTQGVFE